MTPQALRSAKQWAASFFILDVIFTILTVSWWFFTSDSDRTYGFENFTYLFYVPFSLIPFPQFAYINDRALTDIVAVITLVACHVVFGAGLGLLLQKQSIKWRYSIPLAFLIIWVMVQIGLALSGGNPA